MFIAVRRYTSTGLTNDELKSSLEKEFLPKVSGVPGFQGYYAVSTGKDQIATVSIFESEEGEKESTRLAAEYVTEHLQGKLTRVSLDEGPTIAERSVARV